MAGSSILRGLVSGHESSAWFSMFNALMSVDDSADLPGAIDSMNQEGGWPDDFRYGVEGLQSYRDYYEDKLDDMTPEMRARYAEYDEEWSLKLLDDIYHRMYGQQHGQTQDLEIE